MFSKCIIFGVDVIYDGFHQLNHTFESNQLTSMSRPNEGTVF